MAVWGTPIERGRFTAPFGEVRATGVHLGTDIAPPVPGQTGVPVYAMGPGVVDRTGETSIRGHWLLVRHDDGTYSRYQHLASTPSVGAGQRVGAGTVVGICGATGRVTGIHLHLEVYPAGPNPGESQNGATDPEPWARARGVDLRALGTLPTNPPSEEDDMNTDQDNRLRAVEATVNQLLAAKQVMFFTSNGTTFEADILGGTYRGIPNSATLYDRRTILNRTGISWGNWSNASGTAEVGNPSAFGRRLD